MASFPIIQLTEGEWTSEKWYDILGVKLPFYFTRDPAFLRDYIDNFQTRPDDVFIVGYPKSGTSTRWNTLIVLWWYTVSKFNSDFFWLVTRRTPGTSVLYVTQSCQGVFKLCLETRRILYSRLFIFQRVLHYIRFFVIHCIQYDVIRSGIYFISASD